MKKNRKGTRWHEGEEWVRGRIAESMHSFHFVASFFPFSFPFILPLFPLSLYSLHVIMISVSFLVSHLLSSRSFFSFTLCLFFPCYCPGILFILHHHHHHHHHHILPSGRAHEAAGHSQHEALRQHHQHRRRKSAYEKVCCL